jgi:drug/metabolite transporter (DMT)-like permease
MQKATSDPAPGRDHLHAIGLMLLTVLLFSLLDTSAKHLATRIGIPIAEIAWARFVEQFILLAVLVPAFGLMTPKRMFTTARPMLQLVRSVLMAATTVCNFVALQYLRLDQTITIVFLAPLVVAALAGPLLGEWVGWHRALAIMVGFAGILVVVRPGFHEIHWSVFVAMAGMLAYALFMLLTRHLSTYDPPLVTLFYSMFAGTLLGAPTALASWVMPPDMMSWLIFGSLGILGGTGHYLLILAYNRAPASTVSPFIYAQILSMIALGYLVFGDVPDLWTMVGAAIVIGSGIYLVHRERIAHRPVKTAPVS